MRSPESPRGDVVASAPSRLHGVGALLTGGVFNRALGSLRLLIFAPLLGTEGFGLLRLASSASAILAALGGLGLYTAHLRYLPEFRLRVSARRFFASTSILALVGSVGLGAVLALFASPVAAFVFSNPNLRVMVWLLALSLPVTVVYKSLLSATRGVGCFQHSAIGEAIQNLMFLALGALGVWAWMQRGEVVFGASIVAMIAGCLWMARPVRAALSGPPKALLGGGAGTRREVMNEGAAVTPDDPRMLRRALLFSLWYSLIPLFQYFFDFFDRWALARYRDLAEAGAYSLVPILAGGMLLLSASLPPVVLRKSAQLNKSGSAHGAWRLIWAGVSLSVLGSLVYAGLMKAAEPMIWRLAGSNWNAAARVMPWFLCYFALFNVYYMVGCFASLAEKTWVHVISLVLGAAVNVGLNLLWVPKHGMTGAAAATLLGMSVSLAVHFIYLGISRIAIPPRLAGVTALCLIPMLPSWYSAAATLVVLWAAWKTRWVLSSFERRLCVTWAAPLWRRACGAKGGAA